MNMRELMLLLSAAMTAARAPCAQQNRMPVMGYLASTSDDHEHARRHDL